MSEAVLFLVLHFQYEVESVNMLTGLCGVFILSRSFFLFTPVFTGRNIASYAQPCISYDRTVRLSVRHTLSLSQNNASQGHGIFINNSPRTLDFGSKSSSRNSKGFTPSEGLK